MADLRFNVLFKSILVKAGRWANDNACNGTQLTVKKISPRAGLEPVTTTSVGQHLAHYTIRAPNKAMLHTEFLEAEPSNPEQDF